MRRIPPTRPGSRRGRRQTSRRRRVEWSAAVSCARPSFVGLVTFPQIIVGGAERSIRCAIRIEMRFGDHGNAAVLAHLDEVDAARRSCIHPVPALKFGDDTIDGALHSKRLVALDTAKRLLFLQHAGGSRGRAEVDLGLQSNDLFWTSRLAEPALHAGVFNEAQ